LAGDFLKDTYLGILKKEEKRNLNGGAI